jgi:hypothetical protein
MDEEIGVAQGAFIDDDQEEFERWRRACGPVRESVVVRRWSAATRKTARRLRAESAAARIRRCTGPGCKCRDDGRDP